MRRYMSILRKWYLRFIGHTELQKIHEDGTFSIMHYRFTKNTPQSAIDNLKSVWTEDDWVVTYEPSKWGPDRWPWFAFYILRAWALGWIIFRFIFWILGWPT